MSYDLAVFEPRSELRAEGAFAAWREDRLRLAGLQGHDDPAKARPALQSWFAEMIQQFPPMNGPSACQGEDEEVLAKSADYAIAADFIYVAFSWSQAESACDACVLLAQKHGLGFLNVSGNGEAYFPDETGELSLVHGVSPLSED